MYVAILPAYGRAVKSRAEAIAQLRAGKDFQTQHPTIGVGYATMDELIEHGVTHVEVYNGPRLVAVIDIAGMAGK
jgi:hypothetical protein